MMLLLLLHLASPRPIILKLVIIIWLLAKAIYYLYWVIRGFRIGDSNDDSTKEIFVKAWIIIRIVNAIDLLRNIVMVISILVVHIKYKRWARRERIRIE